MELFPKHDPKPAWDDEEKRDDDSVFYVPYAPEPEWENERRNSLAWSLGIAFFISVGIFLFLGWLADLFLGSSPWGMVGGIVIGAVLGFVQFFRITSQMFPTKKDGPAVRPLMRSEDDDNPF